MTIKTRLQVTAIVAILLVLSIGSFIFFVNQELNEVIEENRRADEVVGGVFELNILTNDYLLHRSERISDQWWSRYNSISRMLIEAEVSDDSKKQAHIGVLRESHKSISRTFFQLVTVLGRVPDEERSTASIELEDRLVSQLSARSQTMVASASALARENRQELTERQQQLSLFVLAAIFMLAVIIAISSLLTMTGVLRPLLKLKGGAEIIGKGNLEHRIDIKSKDEIGQLAHAFNTMTAELQKSYSSLEEKVRERTAELEIANNRSEALLASIGDGVFAIDREYKIIHFNRAAEEISGYKASEVLGKFYYDVLKFIKEKDRNENLGFIRKSLAGERATMTDHTLLIRKDKSEVSVTDSASPIKNKGGKILGSIVVFRDASQGREIERLREEFVYIAVHELRSPATAVRAFLELVSESTDKLPKDLRDLLGSATAANAQVRQLIDDLLEISRSESGALEVDVQPLNIIPLIDATIKELSPTAKQKRVTIKMEANEGIPEILGDSKKITEVITNLLSNAIKYNREGGSVDMRVFTENSTLTTEIRDTGYGIPKEQQVRVFQKFFRAKVKGTREALGTGLGLFITKMLVEKMGGKVMFTSVEGKGSTFSFSLPVAK